MGKGPRSFRVRVLTLLPLGLMDGGLTRCAGGQGAQQAEISTLTVLAASSLTDPFGELEGAFEEQNPGTDVQTRLVGSSELPAQIRQGAPADVFASVDEANMDNAAEEGLVREPEIFVRNRPVVIVSSDNPVRIEELRDLAGVATQIVPAQDGVPIVEYTKDVLANANTEHRGDFEQRVSDNIVSREANVRASANRMTLGEADATFVYQMDITGDIRDQVQVIEIPENLILLAAYPIAIVEGSHNSELVQEWIDLVLSDEGPAVLASHGFTPVS
jgi:molybdate transport system substrate-binding protein